MGESDKLSHRPFEGVAGSLKQRLKGASAAAPTGRVREEPVPPTLPPPAPAAPPDGELLERELEDVRRLEPANYVPRRQRPATVSAPPGEEAEVMAQLADLVSGRASFDFAASDEYIEGIALGLDRRLVKRLRQGHFAVQAHLDLHGKTRVEARAAVETFILESRFRGRRCVLIVHGRGLNSKDQVPVLKEGLKVWLARGRIARSVLAFTSARPADGGAGAVYVLLRR